MALKLFILSYDIGFSLFVLRVYLVCFFSYSGPLVRKLSANTPAPHYTPDYDSPDQVNCLLFDTICHR